MEYGTGLAVDSGNEATSRLLLGEGADVAVRDRYGDMALHSAASNGNEAVARLLGRCNCKPE
jgi:ankyrin repeat protein